MNSSTEKFYRLYFYQGVSQGDRAFLHQEFLETQSRRYACTGLVIITAAFTYFGLGATIKYGSFQLLRIAFSGLSGYISYKSYKMYATHLLEQSCDPLYKKYAIR